MINSHAYIISSSNENFILDQIQNICNLHNLNPHTIINIYPEDKSLTISQIRTFKTEIIYKSVNFDKTIYKINDSQCMTTEAQNCLLKTLEEPPLHAIIILAVSNYLELLSTIQSRCVLVQETKFSKINYSDTKPNLKQLFLRSEVFSYLDRSGENRASITKMFNSELISLHNKIINMSGDYKDIIFAYRKYIDSVKYLSANGSLNLIF